MIIFLRKFLSIFILSCLLLSQSFLIANAQLGRTCEDDDQCVGYICIAENDEDPLGACTECNDDDPDFACFEPEICSPAGKCVDPSQLGPPSTGADQQNSTTSGDKANGVECSFDDDCKSGYCAPITGSSLPVCADKPASSSTTTSSNTTSSGIPGATSYNGSEINILGIIKGKNLGEAIVSIYTNAAVPLLGIILFIHIVYGLISEGILWSGDSGKATKFLVAEITNGALAFIILLSAYVILNTINPDLVKGEFSFDKAAKLASSGTTGGNSGGNGGPTGKTPPQGGGSSFPGATSKCKTITDDRNPCSVNNLARTCFGANADKASAICRLESGGNPGIPSGVDICQPGGEKISWGLFQINLTANTVAGLNCPSSVSPVYTSKNHQCSVKNQALYNQCVDAAKDRDKNIQKACELSKNGTRWGPWGANSECNFAK